MGLFDNLDFAQLFKQLSLKPTSNNFRLPSTTPLVGSDYLNNTDEGAQSMWELYTSQFDDATSRTLSRAFQPVYRKYRAAAALQPTLSFEQYLDNFDKDRFLTTLTASERGERPAAYSRGPGGFRYLEG